MCAQRVGILLVMLQLAIFPATISIAFTLQRYNCPKSYTFTNARLQGGLKAGHFRRLGPPDDTELCVQRCCDQRSCDLVAWVGEHCYSVSCVSREMCKPVRLPSYEKGMRLLYIASRDDAEDEVEPSRREVNDVLRLTSPDEVTQEPARSESSNRITRIIRSLEEMEDERSSGLTKRAPSAHEKEIVFSGDYYEHNSETMQFRMDGTSGEDEGDWEGGLVGESGDEDDDAADDIIQSHSHGVTAVKRTEMATVVDPRTIEDIETFHEENSSGESDKRVEGGPGFLGGSGTSSSAGVSLKDDIDQSSSGSGLLINKTIMHEVQRNLHKVWRYASASKNLDMVAKGPKGKEEEKTLQEIYNLLIKHESRSTSSAFEGPKNPKEAESSEIDELSEIRMDFSGESGNLSDEKYDTGSNGSGEKNHENVVQESEVGAFSGEGTGNEGSGLDFSGESSSGAGVVNKKLLKEVEHNLHKVWRYASPKKDLDMVAKGPKGKEEEQKVKKIYNIVTKHESGSAFIDYELQQKQKSVNDSPNNQKDSHRRKSRKSRVKIGKTGYNITEAKLYRLQKNRKNKYNKNLKRLQPWGLGMGKQASVKNNKGKYTKQMGRNEGDKKNTKLAILGQEMKELAPSSENQGNTNNKENSKGKMTKDETAPKGVFKLQSELDEETHDKSNKSKGHSVLLDKNKSSDKTFQIGRKVEELILNRIAELEAQRISKKVKDKQHHLKDIQEETDREENLKKEAQKAKPQLKDDKLVTELEKLKFLNGPSTVYNKSRFVYLKQCGLYVEEYNVSKTRASWNNDLFSPYSYLYEMPENYHTCNSSLRMNRTDLRGDVFLSFQVMSIKGSTMINNANICEKYCCQEPRCQAWTLRLQQADTANCPKGSYCCWLKSAVPTPLRESEHCTSGIVHRESTKHPPSGMRSAVPLGGLGTGSFELRADGTIHEWTIENQSPGGSAKLNKGALNLAVFGVRVADGEKSKASLLRIHAPHGYPGVESLSYSGSYPVSKLTPGGAITEDVDMDLYAFPSFHVREPHKSSVPAVAFTLSLHNKVDKPLDVSFMFNLPLGQQEDTIRVGDNFGEVVFTRLIKPSDCAHACSKMPKCMSWTTNGPNSCLLKDKMPLHAWATGIVSGLKGKWTVEKSMLTCHRPGFFPQSGSTTLYSVDDEDIIGSFAVADDFADIWKNFSETGEIGVSKWLNKTGIYGAASAKTVLQPGEKKSLTIILSWYYPHRDLSKVHVGNLYSLLFKSSQDVAKHMYQDMLQSVIDIQSWHKPIFGTKPAKKKPINKMVKDIPGTSENSVHELPDWLKDMLVNSLSFWRSGFWTEDGRWRQWEAFDCNDIDTIQNDMQRIIPYTLFFPDLVKDLLLSWADNQYSSGMLQEALTSGCLGPTGKLDYAGGRVMADTTSMFVVGLYHYYKWTGDQDTINRLWPAAKRAMAWVMVDSTKGTDLPFRKVSTYDIVALDKYDHDVYNTFVYLLSLRVAEELGDIMNDTHFVTDVRQSFSHAQKRVDLELWDNNKQFYRAWWDMEYGSPEWIMSDSLYGQVWAYSLGLGDLVPRNKLKSHLLSEIERNDSPFGLKVLNTGEAEMTLEDTSIILSKHIPGCKSLENITKHNSIWMGADADWTSLMLNLEADPILALNRARKSLDHWRSTLNDQWNIHGLVASNGYGLDGLPWATSHYSFHLVLWHIPLALSGQRYFAHNASLTFWPKYPIPFNLPFFTPKAMGTIQGAYIKGSDREEGVEEEEEMFTFVVDTGELSLKTLAILGSKYGKGEITLKKGESVTWSRPKQDVENILQQL